MWHVDISAISVGLCFSIVVQYSGQRLSSGEAAVGIVSPVGTLLGVAVSRDSKTSLLPIQTEHRQVRRVRHMKSIETCIV